METIKETPTEIEVLQAQLEIAEAKIISLTSERTGLEARVKDIETLLIENSTAQAVLSKAAQAIGEQLNVALTSSISIPEGLSRQEEQAIVALRESQSAALKERQEELKKYIRGEL